MGRSRLRLRGGGAGLVVVDADAFDLLGRLGRLRARFALGNWTGRGLARQLERLAILARQTFAIGFGGALLGPNRSVDAAGLGDSLRFLRRLRRGGRSGGGERPLHARLDESRSLGAGEFVLPGGRRAVSRLRCRSGGGEGRESEGRNNGGQSEGQGGGSHSNSPKCRARRVEGCSARSVIDCNVETAATFLGYGDARWAIIPVFLRDRLERVACRRRRLG